MNGPTSGEVALTYEKVIGAEQNKLAAILYARSDAILTNAQAGAIAFTTTNIADANRVRMVTSKNAEAALFTNQLPAFAAAPAVYRQRLYLQQFAALTQNARKYVLLATNTQDVLIFDLETKIRDFETLSSTNSP